MTAPQIGGTGLRIQGPQGAICSPLECPQAGQPAEGFADALVRALGDVSRLQATSEETIARFVRGEPVELHQVMAAAEEAAIALELLVEVRNKLSEAYRSIMNMQV
jgi:flagellar hook-basal body complex protein FliE